MTKKPTEGAPLFTASGADDGELPSRPIEELELLDPTEIMLTDAEKKAIRQAARESVVKERKENLKRILMEQYLREERQKLDPEQEEVRLQIALPPFADRVTIDGVVYLNGHDYPMSRKRANSINEIMEYAWRHDDVAFGRRAVGERRREGGRYSDRIANLNSAGNVTYSGNFLRV